MTNKLIEVRERKLKYYVLRIEYYSNGDRIILKKHKGSTCRTFSTTVLSSVDIAFFYESEKEYRETACPYHPGAMPPCSEDGCKCYGRAMNMAQALQSIGDGRM